MSAQGGLSTSADDWWNSVCSVNKSCLLSNPPNLWRLCNTCSRTLMLRLEWFFFQNESIKFHALKLCQPQILLRVQVVGEIETTEIAGFCWCVYFCLCLLSLNRCLCSSCSSVVPSQKDPGVGFMAWISDTRKCFFNIFLHLRAVTQMQPEAAWNSLSGRVLPPGLSPAAASFLKAESESASPLPSCAFPVCRRSLSKTTRPFLNYIYERLFIHTRLVWIISFCCCCFSK